MKKSCGLSGNNQRGFTLTEVLVAMVIVSLFAGGILVVQKNSWSSVSSSNKMLLAGHVIEREIERCRSYIAEDPDNHFLEIVNTSPPSDTVIDGFEVSWSMSYPATYILADPPGAGDTVTNVAEADIMVKWNTTRPESLTVSTYFARDF